MQVSSTRKYLAGLFYILTCLGCLYVFGLYDSGTDRHTFSSLNETYRISKCIFIATLLMEVWLVTLNINEAAGLQAVYLGILAWALLSLWRSISQKKALIWSKSQKVFVLGDSHDSTELAGGMVSSSSNPSYVLAGYAICDRGRSFPQAGFLNCNDIWNISVAANRADANIIAINDQMIYGLGNKIEFYRNKGFKVECLSNIWEKAFGKLPESQAVFLPTLIQDPRRVYVAAKRFLDIFAGLAGMFFLLLVFLPVGFAIKINTPGPIFYAQARCGKNGRTFRLLKFRTMIQDAEPDGPRWANREDTRVTRVGKFLRKTHIDEVPQFINVLRGELSLVGPRPERPEFTARLIEQIPFFKYRSLVRPGITGWAQISGAYTTSVEDAKDRAQFDFFYLKNRSFFLDFIILLKTAKEVVQMRGL